MNYYRLIAAKNNPRSLTMTIILSLPTLLLTKECGAKDGPESFIIIEITIESGSPKFTAFFALSQKLATLVQK